MVNTIYTLNDFTVEFNLLRDVAVKATLVTRNGKTFARVGYKRSVKAASKSATNEAFERLVKSTVNNEALPSRTELAKEVGVMTREFLSNPAKFIKEGKQREQLARDFVEQQLKIKLPTNKELIEQAKNKFGGAVKNWFMKSGNKEQLKDLAVNTSGYVGSKVGGAVGSLPGQLAGDYTGAALARKAINDAGALKAALIKLNGDEAFKSASKMQRLKMVHKESLFAMKQRAEYVADKATEDAAGWAIGNTAAENLPLPIPFKGAIVATPNSQHVVAARKRILAGESAWKVGRDTAGNIGRDTLMIPQRVYKRTNRVIRKGNKREQQLRDKAARFLKQKKQELGITKI